MTGYTINENAAFNGYISKNQTSPPPGFSTGPGPSLGCKVQTEIAYVLDLSFRAPSTFCLRVHRS